MLYLSNFTSKSILYQHYLTLQKNIFQVNISKHELVHSNSLLTKIKII